MVRLPVWELGLIILFPMLIAMGLRGMLEKRLVDSVPAIRQSLMQFRLELGLFLGAGLGMALILLLIYHFPLFQSGMKLVLGIVTVGMFAALDLALARERIVIGDALSGRASFEPPRELSPMTRKFSLVATSILLLITGIIMLVIIRDVHWLAEQDLSMDSVAILGRSVLVEIIFVMGFLLLMVINLVLSYARNLRILFDNETVVLERVSRGDLTRKVPVATRDEMGVIAGHTNNMITALREGVRMREGLLIAQEIQQHFLPDSAPEFPGLELAGSARFSDETGGDFYDFIECERDACSRTAVAVGDVSGHGIGAALLMAAGRAHIRQAASVADSPAEAINMANRHLSRDIEGTGRFLTLFYMELDPVEQIATWVNAGHQPPVLYDSASDTFTELRTPNIPLGVTEDWEYMQDEIPLPGPGQVLLIGTDGAWEAHNRDNEMFGNDRLQQVIRDNASGTAQDVLKAVEDAVHAFTGDLAQEDDLTLVVIKGK
ncbi:SpoIIE family protein phosphatase [Pseudodesulfovibrio sp. zrk46]|uniref:PP2C family protein-serine/threonine phosphatase n=1 Tax=Pseudodesulfovibrio sp. zrk46 TaxID=2725288 RepID=UPI001449ACBE|nr:SpoIIE family protein phosphatase [Pseudodesulfovibrio sp. zrk46]QJB56401.1 SpoIIE family protein phosphatase [Pseudodesulfovibrio sp. zrk46]